MHSIHTDSNFSLNIRGRLYSLVEPQIMGILNLTPDSFYNSGASFTIINAIKYAQQMLEEGADMIDVGAMTSRPFSMEIPQEEEMRRVKEVFPALVKEFPEVIFSIDTYRSDIANFCLGEGASIINDITSARKDEHILDIVSQYNCPYIAMHMLGKPEMMQINPTYGNLLAEIGRFFADRIALFAQKGIKDIILDLGFGFGKSVEDNFLLLKNLDYYSSFNLPLLVGISRKSMIYKSLNTHPDEALNGTTALHWAAMENGAKLLRVHDVKCAKEVVTLHRLYQSQ